MLDSSFYDTIYNDIPSDVRLKYRIVGTSKWLRDKHISHIPIESNATYLDPCVGRGVYIEGLLEQGVKEEQITACDIVEDNIAYCKSKWKNVNYRVCDLMNLSGEWDYVVAVPHGLGRHLLCLFI